MLVYIITYNKIIHYSIELRKRKARKRRKGLGYFNQTK